MKWTPTITARDVGPLLLISLHQSYRSQDYIVKLASCHIPDELSPRTLVISPWVRESVRTQVAQISHLGAQMAEVNPSIGDLLIVPRNSSQTWDSTSTRGLSGAQKCLYWHLWHLYLGSSKFQVRTEKQQIYWIFVITIAKYDQETEGLMLEWGLCFLISLNILRRPEEIP